MCFTALAASASFTELAGRPDPWSIGQRTSSITYSTLCSLTTVSSVHLPDFRNPGPALNCTTPVCTAWF